MIVKPERDKNPRKERREKWWHFAEKCPALYHAIGRGHAFARHPDDWDNTLRLPERVLAGKSFPKLSLDGGFLTVIPRGIQIMRVVEIEADPLMLWAPIRNCRNFSGVKMRFLPLLSCSDQRL